MVTFVSKSRIVKAIREENIKLLKNMLKSKPKYSSMEYSSDPWGDSWSGTILHMAAYYNKPEVIKFFVEKKYIDVNERGEDLGTALHEACYRNAYEAAEMLIDMGVDVTIEDFDGGSALDNCKTKKMKNLLKDAAIEKKKKEVKAEKNREFELAKKKFTNAIATNDIKALDSNLKKYPELSKVYYRWSGSWSGTIVHLAAYYNNSKVIKFLVEEEYIDVNERDKNLGTALHDACSRNAYEAAEILIDMGADITIENVNGDGALDMCNHDKIRELIKDALSNKPIKKRHVLKDPQVISEDNEEVVAVWKANGDSEIIHEHRIPNSNYKITDIFNFKSRYWKSITQDIANNGVVQETKFFDEIPDKTLLHEACDILNSKFGGKVKNSTINFAPMQGKPRLD